MWCNKAGGRGNAGLRCRDEIQDIKKSACCPTALPYSSPINSENFFLNEKCPNLILDLPLAKLKECAGKNIVAKLEAPMVITDKTNSIIDKNGYKVADYNYFTLKDHLNYKGKIKNSTGKSPEMLAKTEETLDRSLWTSDKEVKLKIPNLLSYSPGANDNQDETFFYYDNGDNSFSANMYTHRHENLATRNFFENFRFSNFFCIVYGQRLKMILRYSSLPSEVFNVFRNQIKHAVSIPRQFKQKLGDFNKKFNKETKVFRVVFLRINSGCFLL